MPDLEPLGSYWLPFILRKETMVGKDHVGPCGTPPGRDRVGVASKYRELRVSMRT